MLPSNIGSVSVVLSSTAVTSIKLSVRSLF